MFILDVVPSQILPTIFVALAATLIVSLLLILKPVFKKMTAGEDESENNDDSDPKIVIDPAKAFCQRVKFVMRLKRRMKEFKAKKENLKGN